MKRLFTLSLLVLAATLFAVPSTASAQEVEARSVISQGDLEGALQQRAAGDRAARADLQAVLERQEVRDLADSMGLDLRDAADAVQTLSDEDVRRAAAHARAIDSALSGGNTITISLVAALLIVIIIILLVD